ncbi:MAG: helix-turn-helix transcriptional regulator [Bacilli bacterium]|jgi:putative transcriptional regulator
MKNNLAKLRTQKKLNQEQLADKLGVSRQTIISLEKGHYNPSIILAFKIAKYFDKRIDDIFVYEEEENEK